MKTLLLFDPTGEVVLALAGSLELAGVAVTTEVSAPPAFAVLTEHPPDGLVLSLDGDDSEVLDLVEVLAATGAALPDPTLVTSATAGPEDSRVQSACQQLPTARFVVGAELGTALLEPIAERHEPDPETVRFVGDDEPTEAASPWVLRGVEDEDPDETEAADAWVMRIEDD